MKTSAIARRTSILSSISISLAFLDNFTTAALIFLLVNSWSSLYCSVDVDWLIDWAIECSCPGICTCNYNELSTNSFLLNRTIILLQYIKHGIDTAIIDDPSSVIVLLCVCFANDSCLSCAGVILSTMTTVSVVWL